MSCIPKNPLIAIIGATGTGKSKLAVALAKRFGGEVINSDALQLYTGLPIVTNKIRVHEMCGVQHHLISRLSLDDEPWTITQFTAEALKVIEEIKSRGKVPILVGGTHYYTQNILFRDQTLEHGSHRLTTSEQEERWPILQGTDEQILEKLRVVDPQMAAKFHPKDSRKIRRRLEIWLETGRPASEIYAKQRGVLLGPESVESSANKTRASSVDVPSLRYDSLTFCVHMESEVLDKQLTLRVGRMLDEGLLKDVQAMRDRYLELVQMNRPPDLSRGIWVAIGYKEFTDFLSARDAHASDDAESAELHNLLMRAIEKTQIATKRYARRQLRWIRHKLLPSLTKDSDSPALVVLDYKQASEWQDNVEDPALGLCDEFLNGRALSMSVEQKQLLESLLSSSESRSCSSLAEFYECPVCGVIMTTAGELNRHSQTKRHRRAQKKRRHQLEREQRGYGTDKIASEGPDIHENVAQISKAQMLAQ